MWPKYAKASSVEAQCCEDPAESVGMPDTTTAAHFTTRHKQLAKLVDPARFLGYCAEVVTQYR